MQSNNGRGASIISQMLTDPSSGFNDRLAKLTRSERQYFKTYGWDKPRQDVRLSAYIRPVRPIEQDLHGSKCPENVMVIAAFPDDETMVLLAIPAPATYGPTTVDRQIVGIIMQTAGMLWLDDTGDGPVDTVQWHKVDDLAEAAL